MYALIIIPSQLDKAISFNEHYTDNSTTFNVQGDIQNSQLGGTNNIQVIPYSEDDISRILINVREYSSILDENDRSEPVEVLKDIERSKEINHKAFFEKHPLLLMAVSTITTWSIENRADKLLEIIGNIFK
ncbi:Uncharacterised protein [Chlamydia trachomatis]|nr:Uncharacterised protein [Chlamydia trachomatis]